MAKFDFMKMIADKKKSKSDKDKKSKGKIDTGPSEKVTSRFGKGKKSDKK